MKWGVRRFQNKDGSLTTKGKKRYDKDSKEKKLSPRQVRKMNEKAIQSGRLIDYSYSDVWGIRQKNGDILFVNSKDVLELGVDAAEKKTLNIIKETTAKAEREKRAKKAVDDVLRKEEKTAVKEIMDTYDKNDPDYEEAMSILREIYES